MRHLSWQIWLPRVLLIAFGLLVLQYGLGLATRSKIIGSGEAAIGAHVEVAHARVSVMGRQVVLRDVRVADPRRSSLNLVEADRCEFNVAAGPLLHKQTVIEGGAVTGLRFEIPRERCANLVETRPVEGVRSIQWLDNDVNRPTQEWLEQLSHRFDPKQISQFDSVKRTAGLCDRMPQQTAALDERVRELARRAEELQSKLNSALANPLRHAEFLRAAAQEIPALQREFAQAAEEMERLPGSMDTERRAIVAARRQDEAWLSAELKLPPVDASSLTAYLLRKQLTGPVDELIGWLRLERQIFPTAQKPTRPIGQRGEEIFFAGSDRSPRLLVRELALAGVARVGGQSVELRGTLSDFTSAPALHARPLRVKLAATGSLPMVLQATVDRTGAVAKDELLVDCQNVVLPAAELGETEQFRVTLASSVGSLSISVTLDGEQLTGDIQLVQKNVQITPGLGGELSDVPMTATLGETLGDIGAVATRISLSGTLDEPRCRLWSNLGPAVAEALDRSLHRAAEQHAGRMLAESQKQVDQQLTELERRVAETQAELRPQLMRAAGRLDEIAAQQKPPERITPEQVGRRLPANSLFR